MISVKIIAVGKIKQAAKYLETGISDYAKRLARDITITWHEVAEEAPTATRTVEQIKTREAEAIIKHLTPADRVILLSERGRLMPSVDFAAWLWQTNPPDGGRHYPSLTRIIFIIGGAYGTSPVLTSHVTDELALSPLTFPHQMVRLILMEQLYRSWTLLQGDPYHK